MFRLIRIGALALALLLPALTHGQDESILVDLKVNFGVAFREASWVPVDVIVRNSERNVSGFVEVKTYDFNGTLQSPTYRLPAISDRGSQKRFRLYCKLDRVDRIEASLYHGNRPAAPPTRLQLTSISKKDYLGLVLDDNHHDYGFLSAPEVIGRTETRFHREGLHSDELTYLADNLPCYTSFDIIILGDIDPEGIRPEHRALIRQYVHLGGTLAINLGQNADRYKGTWVEELMGVNIGTNTFLSEPALAVAALGTSGDAQGLSENRKGMVTTLTPTNDLVQPFGTDFQLGSLNSVGSGWVATFTVDAVSGLMIHQKDYLKTWNRLLLRSIVDRPINIAAVIDSASRSLPEIAGVRLFPVSSVIAYLLLYFFIAIVGNWIFWNWMKRREMAWVCLVFFSIAFTSYAMIFGTQGRARSTQLEQLEILELAGNSATGRLHGITGLLAKGSGRFDAKLVHPNTLLSDGAQEVAIGNNQGGGLFGPQSQNAFHFVQGEAGRIEGLTVGASEMRFIQTEAPIELNGSLDVDLTNTEDGLTGTITNNTGLTFSNPVLLYDDKSIWLENEVDGTYTIALNRLPQGGQLETTPKVRPIQQTIPRIEASFTMTVPEDVDDRIRQGFNAFLSQLPGLALQTRERELPPCLLAWVDGPTLGSLDMGDRASIQLGGTLIVAWLDVRDERAYSANSIALHVVSMHDDLSANSYAYAPYQLPEAFREFSMADPIDAFNWYKESKPITVYDNLELAVTVPNWVRGRAGYGLEIREISETTLYSSEHEPDNCVVVSDAKYNRGFKLRLLQFDKSKNIALSATGESTTSQPFHSGNFSTTVYRLDDWENLLTPRSATFRFRAVPTDSSGKELSDRDLRVNQQNLRGNQTPHFHSHLSARIFKINNESVGD